jgi:hypothetical protein
MSEDNDDEPLSRSDLLEEAEPHRIVCPSCHERGHMRILFFKLNDMYYDMEYPPKKGFVTLEVKKRNNEIISGELFPSVNGFGSYDCLNALTVIRERLAFFHNNWMSNKNPDPARFKSLSDGDFSFPVQLLDEPPYISTKGYSSKGFSFEEMNNFIRNLKQTITDNLTENSMLY